MMSDENYKNYYKDFTEKALKDIEKGVSELRDSEKFKEHLKFSSRFPHYSVNNQILIAIQRPEASAVMSYTGWKAVGRYPVEGSKGIKIFSPAPYKVQVEERQQDGTVKEKEVTKMGFKVAHVFDISDTAGKDIPEIAHRLEGNDVDQKLMNALLKASPVPVKFEPVYGSANGFYSIYKQEIVVDNTNDLRHQFHTLAHEIGHAILDTKGVDKDKTRAEKETEAEAIAYIIVCRYLGKKMTAEDAGQYTFGYLASWGDDKLTELKDCMQVIRREAMELIDKVDTILAEQTKAAEKAVDKQMQSPQTVIQEHEQIVADRPSFGMRM